MGNTRVGGEQRPEGKMEGKPCGHLGEEHRAEGIALGVFQEQAGGQSDWRGGS